MTADAAASRREIPGPEASAFMNGRETEYARQQQIRNQWHITLLDYLGMTLAEYVAWKQTGIVPARVLRVWRRA
jgi:hypothetical protein